MGSSDGGLPGAFGPSRNSTVPLEDLCRDANGQGLRLWGFRILTRRISGALLRIFCDLAQHVLSLSVFVGSVPEQVRRLAKHDFKIPDALNVLGRALCVEAERVVFFKSRPLLQCETCQTCCAMWGGFWPAQVSWMQSWPSVCGDSPLLFEGLQIPSLAETCT